jgi:hypothetical protein
MQSRMLQRKSSSLTLGGTQLNGTSSGQPHILEVDAMGNSRVIGICIMIFGALVAADGALMKPFRWWSIGAGVFFVLAGLRYFLRARVAAPPAT